MIKNIAEWPLLAGKERMESQDMKKFLLGFLILGIVATFSEGYAGEKYKMWIKMKSSASTKIDWKKLPYTFTSLGKCQTCLLGNREMGIDVYNEKPVKDLGDGDKMMLMKIDRHGNSAFTVYWRVPWGVETERWEYYCFPASAKP